MLGWTLTFPTSQQQLGPRLPAICRLSNGQSMRQKRMGTVEQGSGSKLKITPGYIRLRRCAVAQTARLLRAIARGIERQYPSLIDFWSFQGETVCRRT